MTNSYHESEGTTTPSSASDTSSQYDDSIISEKDAELNFSRCSSTSSLLGGRFSVINDSRLTSRFSTVTLNDLNEESIRNSLQTAKRWMSFGYNPYKPDAQGYTALHRAAQKGDPQMTKSLLKNYDGHIFEFIAQRSAKHGQTALHIAARSGSFRVLEGIMSWKLPSSIINDKDYHGNTPLHFLTSRTADSVARVLLEHGANPNAKNLQELTPFAVYLLTTKVDNATIAQLLLAYGADAEFRVKDGRTLLNVCISRRLWHVAGCLVAAGADVNACDSSGKMISEHLNEAQFKRLARSFTQPPTWVCSTKRGSCMICTKVFGVFVRRHHCRMCGRLCCGPCTKFKRDLSKVFKADCEVSRGQRVCSSCVSVKTRRDLKNQKERFLASQIGYDFDAPI